MKEETYYLIPKDIICFDEVISPVPNLRIVGEQEFEEDVTVHSLIQEEILISFSKNGFDVKIYVTHLSKPQLDRYKDEFNLCLNEYQIVFKICIKYKTENIKKYLTFEKNLRRDLIFSIILANKNLKLYHYDGHRFLATGGNGQGVFLPYSFIKHIGKGINIYYQSDYEKIAYSHHYSRLEKMEFNEIKEFLNKFIFENNKVIKETIIERFILINCFSWVKEGLFYPAAMILFSCFESVLGKANRINLFNTDPLLTRFKWFRDAAVHSDSYSIYFAKNLYTVLQLRERDGTVIIPPRNVATFNIDDIENVRIKLIEEITREINTNKPTPELLRFL